MGTGVLNDGTFHCKLTVTLFNMMLKANKFKKILSNAIYLMSTGKPYVFFRYLKKYASAILLNRVSPRQIDIALTFDCNLKCDHCFTAPLYNKNEKELSYDVLKQVAKECLELGITVIHFTGGEVLMRDDLEEVIKLFNPRRNIIYIQVSSFSKKSIMLCFISKKSASYISVMFYPIMLLFVNQ